MTRRVRAHPAAIGAFVVGAIALIVVAALVFGASGKLFGRKFPIVMFFDHSVNGLAVGAQVAYRGIRLGQVTRIQSVVGSPRIAVTATLERGPFLTPDNPTGTDQMRRAIEEAVGQGLRAQLALQSLLTGHLYVTLVLRPDVPASLVNLDKDALEIPTIPTLMAQLEAGLQKIPVSNMPKHLYDTVEGTARLLQSPDLSQTLAAVGPLAADAQTLVRRLDREIGPLLAQVGPLLASVKQTSDTARVSLVDVTQQLDRVATRLSADASRLLVSLTDTSDTARGTVKNVGDDVQKTLGEARGTVKNVGDDVQKTLGELTPKIASLAVRLQEAADALRGTLATTETTIRDVDGAFTGDSPLGYQLRQALKEVAVAAQALQALAEYLERHPESLVQGRSPARNNR